MIPAGATAVDSVFQFCPAWGTAMFTLTSAATTGGALGLPTNPGVPNFLLSSAVGSYRCVAACVRPHYTGTELNRSGLVGTSLQAGPQLIVNTAPANAIGVYVASSQRIVRFGEEVHEARWFPQDSDGNFVTNSDPPGQNVQQLIGAAVVIAVQNAYVGTTTYEVNAVWEWSPNTNAGNGLSNAIRAPRTAATLNTTLSKVKNIIAFATEPSNREAVNTALAGMAKMAITAGSAIAAVA